MKLRSVHAENFRAIRSLTVPLDPALTVLHGNNAHGKTSVLTAIAIGLSIIPAFLGGGNGREFQSSDVRAGSAPAIVTLETRDGLGWRRASDHLVQSWNIYTPLSIDGLAPLQPYLEKISASLGHVDLPLVAYYDTDRAVFAIPQKESDFRTELHPIDAYADALTAKTSFAMLVEWFYANENRELRAQRDRKDFDYRLPGLDAVRRAISSMLSDIAEPHIEYPAQFVVWRKPGNSPPEKLLLEQLSGGYRIVLAMAADLALRMALANPHLPDPLQSEAIVLIDEIELHLHPEWQQRILCDLRRTFPNAQFIVSTHSPQVLTTVEPQHIIHLRATEDGIVAEQETGPTFGAKAGNVLRAVMGVDERPPHNAFTQLLKRYQTLIADNAGETPPALTLRRKLEALSPQDPALAALDVEIQHHRFMRELADRS